MPALAAAKASSAAAPSGATVGAVAEPGEQRAGEQRVDLVVLRDQDREAGVGGFRAFARRRRIHVESVRRKRAASEAARTGFTR